ncbi:MAG: cisplatin damage response ATP-dependent DNA ligase [Pikeienuella sp.]
MKQFATLFTALDGAGAGADDVAALSDYLTHAAKQDSLWVIALLSGQRPKRSVTTNMLREWAIEWACIPAWLFEDCYSTVGDVAETIALISPKATQTNERSLAEWMEIAVSLRGQDATAQKGVVLNAWTCMSHVERFLFNKLITGGFRAPTSQKTLVQALAVATGVDETTLAHSLSGPWTPETVTFDDLVFTQDGSADLSRPYPFCPAVQIDGPPLSGGVDDWVVEPKWEGIRAQLILRGGQHFLWSRRQEIITGAFPEFATLAAGINDGSVIDGEIVAWADGATLPHSVLQRRVGRKKASKTVQAEAPVALMAFDLLEDAGKDIRAMPYVERRARLTAWLKSRGADRPVKLSPLVHFQKWNELAAHHAISRRQGSAGLMLKHTAAPYPAEDAGKEWQSWNATPMTVTAAIIYAHAVQGRGKIGEFTFAVWRGNELIPLAKAVEGLSAAEIGELATWVRQNTLERYGPVRSVRPEHVFEIAFEGIHASPRLKSGLALRSPRVVRWAREATLQDVAKLEDLTVLLNT